MTTTSSKDQIKRGDNSHLECLKCGLVFPKTEISRNCPLCAAEPENFKSYKNDDASDRKDN